MCLCMHSCQCIYKYSMRFMNFTRKVRAKLYWLNFLVCSQAQAYTTALHTSCQAEWALSCGFSAFTVHSNFVCVDAVIGVVCVWVDSHADIALIKPQNCWRGQVKFCVAHVWPGATGQLFWPKAINQSIPLLSAMRLHYRMENVKI